MRKTEGGRHSAQIVDRTARERCDVLGNQALPQGQGAVVFQEVQVTQDVTDVNDNINTNEDTERLVVTSYVTPNPN